MNVFKDKVFGNGNNYVYYKRLETDPRFKGASRVFAKATATIGKYNKLINSINLNIVNVLKSQAIAERQKEIQVLQKIAPNINYDNMSPIELINQINKLIGLKDKYKDYLKYLKNWYPKTQAKNMSPVVSSYMSTKIASLINKYYIDDFTDNVTSLVLSNADSSKIKVAAEQFANKVINDFISDANNITTELLTEMSTVGYTLGEENLIWEDILNQINSDASAKKTFITDVMNRFGLQKKIEKAADLIKRKVRKTSKGAIRKSIESTAAPQGGNIYEVITGFMQGFAVNSNISTSRISDKGTTDLLTVSVTFDYQQLVKEKVEELQNGVNSKQEAVQKMTEFTDFLKNNVGDGFIIYGNAKSYKLDRLSDKKGYFDGGTRNIQQLPSFMKQYNIPITEEAVELIINTIPGAILEGNNQIQEFLTEALAGQIAKLLFDDWTTIGDQVGNFNAIHVFNLSGITVPLSYLLENMAIAAEEAENDLINHPSSYFQIQFNLPNKIRYEESSETTADIIKWKEDPNFQLEEGETYLQHAWNMQKEEALASTFGVNFLSNFNQLLNQLMKSIGI